MQQVHAVTPFITTASEPEMGELIPALTHHEGMAMTAEELQRFLTLIQSLSDDDWNRATACTLWTVKDIVAHQAAHIISFTSLRAFLLQLNPLLLRRYLKNGMNMLDAWNQSQVDLRRDKMPLELIAEIRDNAPASLKGKDRIPGFLLVPSLPLPGLDQPRSLGYVFDLIYPRDMWMHRIDIANALGRSMTFDGAHDKRMVALIVRDLAQKSRHGLKGRAALLTLKGATGGTYRIGADTAPETMIEIDIVSFSTLTSGREKVANILTSGLVSISGDLALGRSVLDFAENRVLY